MPIALPMPSRPFLRQRPPWYMPAFGWNRKSSSAKDLIAWLLPVPSNPPTFVDIVSGRRMTLAGGGTNPSYVVDPIMGPCIDFPASSNYYTLLGMPPRVTGGSPYPFSVMAWIKPSNVTAVHRGVAGVSEATSAHAMWIGQNGSSVRMRCDDGVSEAEASAGTLVAGRWELIAGSVTSSSARNAFHLLASGSNATLKTITTLDSIVVGINANFPIEPFLGRIADIRFFSSSITTPVVMSASSLPSAFNLYNWGRHPVGGEAAADPGIGWFHSRPVGTNKGPRMVPY